MRVLSVVVPVYDEIESLPLFYDRIKALAAKLDQLQLEILFVDDGSTDGSFDYLSELAKKDKRVRVIRFSRNFGSYIALTAGLANATGDGAITLSADLQDPPELIPEMVNKWREGYDVVWAARRSRSHDPFWRRITSGLFYAIFRRIAFANYPPKGYDFCLIDRVVIDAVSKNPERNTSIFALIVWASFRSTAVEYDRGPRVHGETHWNLRKLIRLAIDSIVSFSSLPVRLSLWCSVLVGCGLILYCIYIVYGKMTGKVQFPPGWPSTMAVILLASGMQFLVLAVLGEYLWRALDQTRGRPLYVISRRLGYPSERPQDGAKD